MAETENPRLPGRRTKPFEARPRPAPRHRTNPPRRNSRAADSINKSAAPKNNHPRQAELRAESIPTEISIPADLPIGRHAREIERLIDGNQVLVVAGDTGSGKTTQLPKICLRAGLGRRGMIGHTQPRRLAALSVANRIAEELGAFNGSGVGTQIRFDERVAANTYLKLMTDGILLTEIRRDRLLKKYQALIIDEAHERSLNVDFLLGYLKLILPRRRDLKLIITSATLDVERIAAHFGGAPIVRVAGRGHPVETLYRPLEQLAPEAPEEEKQMAAVAAAVAILDAQARGGSVPAGGQIPEQPDEKQLDGTSARAETRGTPTRAEADVLVFLSSEKEIRETAAYLRKRRLPRTEILPLYSRLPAAEQKRIFQPGGDRRRIVLATNIAETSLTVPGIHGVIDAGFARVSRYSLQRKLLRLPIEPVSRASADQRKGRCGRIAPGVCVRLYGKRDYLARPEFTDPEIKRSNLASVLLRMGLLRLDSPEDFPFLDAPEKKSINDGRRLLWELGTVDAAGDLTCLGRKIAELPLEPQLGRMLVAAAELGSLRELLVIVSALSLGDLWESGPAASNTEKRAEFTAPESDFLGLLTLWERCEKERASQSRLRKFCGKYGLSFQRVREWREIHRQTLGACRRLQLALNSRPAGYAEIHRALLSGLLNQIARHDGDREYVGSRNRKLSLAATSVLARKKTRWIVTNEWVDTSRTFATMAARINPAWVIPFARHLIRREYSEAFWSADRQQVMVYEKKLLYGLALREKFAVDYAKLDRAGARDVFLDQALIEGKIRCDADFLRRNGEFLAALRKQEEKFRRPETVVNDREIQLFYEERIPGTVVSTRTLENWLAKDPAGRNRLLDMKHAGLFRGDAEAELERQFPDRIQLRHNTLTVDYVFQPGDSCDGAAVLVPKELLAQLSTADLDWAVPGLVREKCISLLRGLPKSKRRNFVPVPDFVDRILPRMSRADGELIDSLLRQISAAGNVGVTRDELSAVELPAHLRTRLRVVASHGRGLAESADLGKLQKRFANIAHSAPPHPLERRGMKDWELEELPESVHLGAETVLLRYPALVDEGDSVAIELLDSWRKAVALSRRGVLRLLLLRAAARRNALQKKFLRFKNANAAKLLLLPTLREIERDAAIACFMETFALHEELPRNRQTFNALLHRHGSRLPLVGEELESLLARILERLADVRRELGKLPAVYGQRVREDIQTQLAGLFPEGFLQNTEFKWLRHYPRYLDGIRCRLEKAPHFGPADEKRTREMAYYTSRFEQLRGSRGESEELMRCLRWSIEEFRVSLFAQRLGTAFPVSGQRLNKQIKRLTA